MARPIVRAVTADGATVVQLVGRTETYVLRASYAASPAGRAAAAAFALEVAGQIGALYEDRMVP